MPCLGVSCNSVVQHCANSSRSTRAFAAALEAQLHEGLAQTSTWNLGCLLCNWHSLKLSSNSGCEENMESPSTSGLQLGLLLRAVLQGTSQPVGSRQFSRNLDTISCVWHSCSVTATAVRAACSKSRPCSHLGIIKTPPPFSLAAFETSSAGWKAKGIAR